MKHIKITNKTKRLKSTISIALSVLTSFFSFFTFAAPPFAGGTSALKSDLLSIIAPIAGIAIIAVGVICWFGKISWWWFGGLIVGIILVFGNDQIVTWIRGIFGV